MSENNEVQVEETEVEAPNAKQLNRMKLAKAAKKLKAQRAVKTRGKPFELKGKMVQDLYLVCGDKKRIFLGKAEAKNKLRIAKGKYTLEESDG